MKELADKIRSKPEFEMYTRLDRAGKYIICRLHVRDHGISDPVTGFFRDVNHRNRYSPGDLRVSFYYAACPEPVYFLAQ